MQNIFRNLALTTVALTAIAGATQAQSITQTKSFPSNLTRWGTGTGTNPTVNFTFNKFDASTLASGFTYTLNSAVFSINGNVVTTFTGSNNATQAGQEQLTSAGEIRLYKPGTTVNNVNFSTAAATLVFTTPTNTQLINVAAGASFGPVTVTSSGSNTATYTDNATLSPFIGSGTIDTPVAAIGNAQGQDIINGNSTFTVVTNADAAATLVYNYTATPNQTSNTPEASDVAFAVVFGTGLMGLIVRARRRNA